MNLETWKRITFRLFLINVNIIWLVVSGEKIVESYDI